MIFVIGTKSGNVKDFATRDAMVRASLLGRPLCKPVRSIVPEQPWELEETTRGAEFRAAEVERIFLSEAGSESVDELKDRTIFLGCENGICTLARHENPEKHVFFDPAVIVARHNGVSYYATSFGISVPTKYVLEAKEIIRKGLAGEPGGDKDMTVGKVIARHLGCDYDNWHKTLTNGRYDRRIILADAIYGLLSQIPGILG